MLALAALAATAAVLAATVHYDHRTHPQESPDDSTEQLIAEAMGGAKTGQRQPR